MKTNFFLCLFLVNAFLGYSQSSSIVIDSTIQDMVFVGKQTYFLEDTSGKLTIQDISKPEQKFQKLNKDIFNRPATNAVFWFRFTIKNQSKQRLWLKTGYRTATWYADFYTPDGQGKYASPIQSGALRPQKDKAFHKSSYYYFPLADKENTNSQTYYLKVQGGIPQVYIFQIGNMKTINSSNHSDDLVLYTFVGFIIAISCYSLFLYFSIWDKTYLYFVFHLVVVLFSVPFNIGSPLVFHPFLLKYLMVWHPISILAPTLFSIHYFNLKKVFPKAYRFVVGYLICLSIFSIFNIITPQAFADLVNIYQPISLINLVVFTVIAIRLWRRGVKDARMYLFSWVPFYISIILFVLLLNGVLPINDFTEYVQQIGVIIQTLFFSIALGERWNALKKINEENQQKMLQMVSQQNEILEEKVKEKTQALQNTNEELLTSNEELQQSQEEIAAQRDKLEETYLVAQHKSKVVDESIKAAYKIQQAILPSFEYIKSFLPEHFVIYNPKNVVSGDFYWAEKIGDQIFVAAVDCTGHGIPGAFMSMIAKTLLDHIIKFNNEYNPSNILDLLHEGVVQGLKQEENKDNNGMALALIVLKKSSSSPELTEINFAGAKRPLHYIQDEKIETIKGSRKYIGGLQNLDIAYDTHTIHLPSGSLLYFGSDGLEDQNNKKRRRFGQKQLTSLLLSNHKLPMIEQKQRLEQALQEHMQDTDQRDDILWTGIKL